MAALVSFLLLGASALVEANPIKARTPYAVKSTHNPPSQWIRLHNAPEDHVMDMHIGLKQSNFAELERQLYQVSDPDHPRYGQHLTTSQVDELVKPTDETHNLVHEWLADNGILSEHCQYNSAKNFIKVSLPLSAIEQLLDTKYSVFENVDDGDQVVRTTEWSLPRHLHSHIDMIAPTNSFMRPQKRRTTYKIVHSDSAVKAASKALAAANTTTCDATAVTPSCLRTLYNTIDYVPTSAGKNKMSHTNYLGEISNYSDVSQFLKRYRPDATFATPQDAFTAVLINGGNNSQVRQTGDVGVEANLDTETLLAIGYPTPLTTFNTGGSPPFKPDLSTPTDTNEPYLDWLNYVLNMTDIPQVISNSYGDDEQTVPPEYAQRVCQMFGTLGAMGVSIFFSSGDSGVGGNGACISNDGKNTPGFLPSFPAGCPYVTTVGATKNFNPEVVAYDSRNGFSSGGGFSNYFAQPDYQKDVVSKYIATQGTTNAGQYNSSGRAYPDVAAQGQAYVTIWRGGIQMLDGTSASCPTFAGVITLLNDALITAGKPPLGFLNPWLYKTGHTALTDITSGSTLGCGGNGFPAAAGWDPATGFGTPDFKKLRALVDA